VRAPGGVSSGGLDFSMAGGYTRVVRSLVRPLARCLEPAGSERANGEVRGADGAPVLSERSPYRTTCKGSQAALYGAAAECHSSLP